MYLYHRINASYSILILSLLFISCAGQNTASIPVTITKVHQDSISLKAETQPEYRNSVHDTDYQGNQISGVIRTVFEDSKGAIWFGTQSGLARYDKNGLVYFELKDSYGTKVTVYVVLEDDEGMLWIGFGGGIAKFDGNYFTVFHEKNILVTGGLWSMAMDKKGLLWVGTTQGVFTFDGKELTPFEIPEGKINTSFGVSTAKMIHSIVEDSKGRMWFATNGGAYVYDGTTLKNVSEKEGHLSNFVHQIIESKDGDFWISTPMGIYKYNGNSFINITEKLIGKEDGIGCMFEDKKGTLWFSVNKRDIYSYDGVTFTKIEVAASPYIPFPFSIYQDKQDRLWFVGFKGAFRYDNDTIVNINRNGPW